MITDLFCALVVVFWLVLFAPFWAAFSVYLWVERAFNYRGAPATGCRTGCRNCPWGNRSLRRRRGECLEQMREFRRVHGFEGPPRLRESARSTIVPYGESRTEER